MPKVVPDDRLAEQVRTFVDICGGCGSAARKLGVNRASLWRFCQSGRAIPRTRARLIAGLSEQESATEATENATIETTNPVPASISFDDLARLRAFFQTMIMLVDAFAPQLAAATPQYAAKVADEQPDESIKRN